MTGTEVIKQYLIQIPEAPGIYRMLGGDGQVLYVGKANNLKKRVTSYTNLEKLSDRIRLMVSNVRSVEFIVTANEVEALLLEANLIKKHGPRYNILLRDDKSFPYIFISGHESPMIGKHRGAKSKKGNYYGPFASASDVYRTLATLQKTFLLRNCEDSVFSQRKRPCLEYQIKRCSAPCVNRIDKEGYQALVKQAKDFLEGRSSDVQKELIKQMEQASENLEYEKAASLRDRIKSLTQIQSNQLAAGVKNTDIIGVYTQGGECCVQILFYRNGQYFGSKPYFPAHTDGSNKEEIMEAFITGFYLDNVPPSEILISHEPQDIDAITEALKQISGNNITIICSQKGKKRELTEKAVFEAKGALIRKLSDKSSHEAVLAELTKIFGLEEAPKRIEVFDNSHIMGKHQVGAMIVAGPEGFIKNSYRRFNIYTDITAGDDYGMLREVLTRRYTKLQKEIAEADESKRPDLILIDGGPGHMKVAEEVFANVGINIPFACIAKGPNRNAGEETFFIPGKAPFQLEKQGQVLFYLQRLRDEAHRFAITSHRGKRSKDIQKSMLDEIKGIGAKRKKALLNYFGSLKAVEQATVNDLALVPGIEKNIAQIIYDYLHR